MSSSHELEEHRGYLADERKTAAYRAALAEVVGPDDVVLDLGAGSGLLGYFACDAGASSVLAVDRGDIVELARQIASDNGYADRISHIKALSTGLALDTRATVAVCDQIGGLVHDAGILGCFADARERLLVPDATLVPASFRIFMAPVRFDQARTAIDFWLSKPSGLDVSAAHEVAVNSEWMYRMGDDDETSALSPGAEIASFGADHDSPISGSAEFQVDQPGRFDGYLGWFEAQMSPSITLTNDPWSPERFDRWCNFYAVDAPVELEEGDRVRLQLDIRPRLGVVTWATTCTREGERLATSRNTTFRGSFLAPETIIGAEVDRPLAPTARTTAIREALNLLDGCRSQSELVTALSPMIGGIFLSRNQLMRFVRDLADLIRG
jgi:predicted RNA methylase